MSFADETFIAGSTPFNTEPSATAVAVVAVKASAGQINVMQVTNSDTVWAYLKVFNVAAGSVTLGTTAAVLDFGIPPGGGFVISLPFAFTTAISVAVSGAQGTTDHTALANANKQSVNIGYS